MLNEGSFSASLLSKARMTNFYFGQDSKQPSTTSLATNELKESTGAQAENSIHCLSAPETARDSQKVERGLEIEMAKQTMLLHQGAPIEPCEASIEFDFSPLLPSAPGRSFHNAATDSFLTPPSNFPQTSDNALMHVLEKEPIAKHQGQQSDENASPRRKPPHKTNRKFSNVFLIDEDDGDAVKDGHTASREAVKSLQPTPSSPCCGSNNLSIMRGRLPNSPRLTPSFFFSSSCVRLSSLGTNNTNTVGHCSTPCVHHRQYDSEAEKHKEPKKENEVNEGTQTVPGTKNHHKQSCQTGGAGHKVHSQNKEDSEKILVHESLRCEYARRGSFFVLSRCPRQQQLISQRLQGCDESGDERAHGPLGMGYHSSAGQHIGINSMSFNNTEKSHSPLCSDMRYSGRSSWMNTIILSNLEFISPHRSYHSENNLTSTAMNAIPHTNTTNTNSLMENEKLPIPPVHGGVPLESHQLLPSSCLSYSNKPLLPAGEDNPNAVIHPNITTSGNNNVEGHHNADSTEENPMNADADALAHHVEAGLPNDSFNFLNASSRGVQCCASEKAHHPVNSSTPRDSYRREPVETKQMRTPNNAEKRLPLYRCGEKSEEPPNDEWDGHHSPSRNPLQDAERIPTFSPDFFCPKCGGPMLNYSTVFTSANSHIQSFHFPEEEEDLNDESNTSNSLVAILFDESSSDKDMFKMAPTAAFHMTPKASPIPKGDGAQLLYGVDTSNTPSFSYTVGHEFSDGVGSPHFSPFFYRKADGGEEESLQSSVKRRRTTKQKTSEMEEEVPSGNTTEGEGSTTIQTPRQNTVGKNMVGVGNLKHFPFSSNPPGTGRAYYLPFGSAHQPQTNGNVCPQGHRPDPISGSSGDTTITTTTTTTTNKSNNNNNNNEVPFSFQTKQNTCNATPVYGEPLSVSRPGDAGNVHSCPVRHLHSASQYYSLLPRFSAYDGVEVSHSFVNQKPSSTVVPQHLCTSLYSSQAPSLTRPIPAVPLSIVEGSSGGSLCVGNYVPASLLNEHSGQPITSQTLGEPATGQAIWPHTRDAPNIRYTVGSKTCDEAPQDMTCANQKVEGPLHGGAGSIEMSYSHSSDEHHTVSTTTHSNHSYNREGAENHASGSISRAVESPSSDHESPLYPYGTRSLGRKRHTQVHPSPLPGDSGGGVKVHSEEEAAHAVVHVSCDKACCSSIMDEQAVRGIVLGSIASGDIYAASFSGGGKSTSTMLDRLCAIPCEKDKM